MSTASKSHSSTHVTEDIPVRTGHVLGDHPAHAAQRLAPLARGCAARGGAADVFFGDAPRRTGTGDVVDVDSELLRDLAHERRRAARRRLRAVQAPRRRGPIRRFPADETSTVPTATISPSATRMRATTPAAGEGISTVALSVWISTSGSSSAISWPSVDEPARHLTLGEALAESGSLNSYATSDHSREAQGVVGKHRVDAADPVDELRDPQVDYEARERERVARRGRALGPSARASLPWRSPQPRRGPRRTRTSATRPASTRRCRELQVVSNRQRELGPLDRALDRELRHLTVSLAAMAVAGREQRAVDRYRQVEGRARDELLAVDVPANRRGGSSRGRPARAAACRSRRETGGAHSRPSWSRPSPAAGSSVQ